ncbi:hypothetical protein J3R30DRAFT_3531778 [Lentinula aciculospora]|uniref:Kinase-like protein n=1 Tax=Lentinula aciculospora TaxID=153920 RepID=A0A9W9DHK2_9AGAR|nr:hypothetical protein J3R30DRAFT_3531778 [Lentinula aciculospora]
MPSIVSARQSGSSSSPSQKGNTSFGRLSTGSPEVSNPVIPRRSSSLKKVSRGKGGGKGRSSVSTLTFEEPESTVFIDREMLKNHMDTAPSRRGPVRIDQDGPWSVSVAESPHDSRSYSLYIKTPTHNLTLTRTVIEIVELDHKLRDSVMSTSKLPALPLDPASIPVVPKRKSAFLNTLSRLASPTSVKSGTRRSVVNGNASAASSGLPTPAASPSIEQNDPFVSFTASSALLNAAIPTPSATSSALAAYFTTLSNLQPVRQARAWKRFVRVRTDDLESTRVERAIKRVRSDLAAHVGGTRDKKDRGNSKMNKLIESLTPDSKTPEKRVEQGHGQEGKAVPVEDHMSSTEEESDEPDKEEGEGKELPDVPEPKPESGSGSSEASNNQPLTSSVPEDAKPVSPSTTAEPIAPIPADSTSVVDLTSTPRASEEEPRTPAVSEAPAVTANRMPRSQSADPDRRMSRAYHSSVNEGNLSSSQTETGDESSSISTAARSVSKAARKRRKETTSSAAASLNGSGSQKELGKKKSQRKVVVDDFEMLRVLGKGCAGKVLLVRHKATTDLYAMKAITKRHVLAHQELQHTLTEQAVLKRMAAVDENGQANANVVVKDPFVVKLWWSFHDKENLFLVMDFHPGGDLATQLARWGRLGRDRARFYAAEIVEGVEGLHAAGVIYRDLKPENILIGADGHIVLTDFGLSKEFPRRRDAVTAPPTPSGKDFAGAQPPWMNDANSEIGNGTPAVDTTTTFCGTAEYLAPEVIQALPYSYEIDWWSFGTMLYEMLTGITPFWANNHPDMYVRVLQDELQFPDDRSMDQDTKSLIRGLLQRNPALRICEPRIKRHPYFSMIDWSHVYYKRYIPPYIPPIDPQNASDTQNFDETFLDMEPVLDDFNDNDNENDNENTDTDQEHENTDTDRTDGEETNTTPSQSRSSSLHPISRTDELEDDSVDVFDGYSFKGRHSVVIDDEQEEEESEEEVTDEEEDEDEDIASVSLGDLVPPPIEATAEILEEDEELPEPKTPEARPKSLPIDEEVVPPTATPSREPSTASPSEVPPAIAEVKPRRSKELPVESAPPPMDKPKPAPPVKTQIPKATRPPRRKERSGVHALDRYLSDGPDEVEATERDEDEDDDWDFIEADGGEDRNGAKGTSLFARGVVDRYRLTIFGKGSTPSRSDTVSRSVSGMSKTSDPTVSPEESPSPSIRRGRNQGLTFRRTPRQFLQPRSPPPSSFSSKSSKTLNYSNSATMSSSSSSGGLLTPATSTGGSTVPVSAHSLKSKESAASVGAQSYSSDTSANGDTPLDQLVEEPGKYKNKKLKKYKENAEKVFSIFSNSPRQPSHPS